MRYARLRYQNQSSLDVTPQTVTFDNYPKMPDNKGDAILVNSNRRARLLTINGSQSYKWLMGIGNMLINGDYHLPKKEPKAERIGCGGDVVYITIEESNFGMISAPLYKWPAETETYQSAPWHIHKVTCKTRQGALRKPGNGLNVYFMLMHDVNPLWVLLDKLEYFPEVPRIVTTNVMLNVREVPYGNILTTLPVGCSKTIVDYLPQGSDVWGELEEGGYICLAKNVDFYTDWTMETLPPLV